MESGADSGMLPDESGTLREALGELGEQSDAELRRARAHAHQAMFGEAFGTDGADGDGEPLIVGRYRLLANVGHGGLGNVWAAHDPHLDRVVALKLLRDDVLRRHRQARAQLLAEAAIMARLTHPNVVRVYDLGDADGELYVAMEYVEGQTLRAWQRAAKHDWRQLVEVYLQAGDGLAAAHGEGLVHGDFKPDNVLIGGDNRVLVSDFAVAQHVLKAHATVEAEADTQRGDRPVGETDTLADSTVSAIAAVFVGTPAYMAPEQLDGGVPDALSDQFAFCVALWEALHGDRPFPGTTWSQLRESIRSTAPGERERSQRMPARLLAILRRGLAERPEDRYPDLDALLADLRRLAGRRRQAAIVLALLALVVAGTAGLVYGLTVTPPETEEQAQECPMDATADVLEWHPEHREALAQRLRSGAGALGQREAEQVLADFDRFAAGWDDARSQTCAFLVTEGEADHSNFHDRAFCMYAGAAAFEASVEVLMAPEAELRLVAQALASELPDPRRCVAEDPERRHYDDKPPSLEVRRKLARANALHRGQRHAEALAIVEELRAVAEAESQGKVLALVEMQRGVILHGMGRNREALRTLERAQALAEVTSTLSTELGAAHQCARVAMTLDDDPAQIDAWAERTVLLAEDFNDPAVVLDGRLILGYAALRAGDGEQALAIQTQALADAELIYGADWPQLAHAHELLGVTHGELGHVEEARVHGRRAIELIEARFGPDHLDVATLLQTSGKIMLMVGERDEARALLERAHASLRELLGPEHRRTRGAAALLAGYWFDEGERERAEAVLDGADDPSAALLRAEFALELGDHDRARIELEHLRSATATADPQLRIAVLELEGRLAFVDPQIRDGSARARVLAETIEILAHSLAQPRYQVRALSVLVAADAREGVDDPARRARLEQLLGTLPGLPADVRARARVTLWRATSTDDKARFGEAAHAAVRLAYGPGHPLRQRSPL